MAPLSPVWSAVGRVRRRLRLQAAALLAVRGLLAAAAALLLALVLLKLRLVAAATVWAVAAAGGGLVGLLALLGALRRIDPLRVAAQIDHSHALHDRLASALQFAAAPARAEAGAGSQLGAALRALAQQDAARAAQGVVPAIAAPWQRPAHLPLLAVLLIANLGVLVLRWPRPRPAPPPATATSPGLAEAPRLYVEPELLAPEKEELQKLIAEAQQQGDTATAALLEQMQKLLEEVERGELTRQEAFARLSELEQRLMQGKDGTLEDLKQQLRRAGSELGEAKLSKELGQALLHEDLERAQKELKKLAEQALARTESAQQSRDKQALAQAFEQAARSLSQKPDKNQDKSQDKNLKREDPRDPSQKKDEWKDQSKSEELTRKLQELRDEERSLKKKLQENPRDEESARRLKKNQRELEHLEQEKRERDEARRELEQLEKDLEKAAEQLQQQLAKMTPEQRQALEQLAKDMDRMADEIRKLQKQQKGRGQGMVALGSIKTVLRRIARSAPGGGQGQGQGQGDGQQPGQGQGQGQGQGKSGAMKDFQNRASGKGQGQGNDQEVLVEGEGQKGDGQVMILGEGEGTVLLPGLGGKQAGNQPGQGAPGQPGGDGVGNQHDPNLLGSSTQLDGKRRLTKVTGKEGAGPTRSETILGAAERGFASAPYRKVYKDYTGVAEQVMSKERVPPGYRFYVKRYFQMIKPRE
jgi:hypothetical protein